MVDIEQRNCPRDYFGDSRFIEFEGNYLPIPELYHEYLSQIYGDYMKLPPLEKDHS